MPIMVHLQMEVRTCITCGVQFGLMISHDAELQRNHKAFYCPNGHQQRYTGETEAERLKKQNVRLQQQLDQERAAAAGARQERDALDRKLIAARGQQTKLKKRVAAGVCPCCHRTFKQLAAHMADVHPEFVDHAKKAKCG